MTSRVVIFSSLAVVICTIGCSPTVGKYYENDGPPSLHGHSLIKETYKEEDLKIESPHRWANRPYRVMGQSFTPVTGDKKFVQTGIASWYGKQFHGRKTATGEIYDMYAMTAAHPTMELPSYARVTNLVNGKSVIVRVNDRGPFIGNRAIDMSYGAAVKLDYIKTGTTKVRIERITRKEIASGAYKKHTQTVVQNAVRPQKSVTQADDEIAKIVIASEPAEVKEENQELTSQSVSVTESSLEQSSAPVEVSGKTLLLDTGKVLKNGWSIQVGAFRSQLSAEEMAAHTEMMLSEHNIDMGVTVVNRNGLYRVLVGKDKEVANIRKQMKLIEEVVGHQSFITQSD